MTHTAIINLITPIFQKVFKEPNLILVPENTAADFEKWDSINHVIIMARVEKLLGIKIDTAELIHLKSVGDLVNLIAKKLPDEL